MKLAVALFVLFILFMLAGCVFLDLGTTSNLGGGCIVISVCCLFISIGRLMWIALGP